MILSLFRPQGAARLTSCVALSQKRCGTCIRHGQSWIQQSTSFSSLSGGRSMLFSWRKYNQRLPMIQQRTSQLRRFGSKEIKPPLNNNEGCHLTDIQKLQDQLTNLQSTLQSLTYQIHQSQSATLQTQALARRSEARAYIIEQKLMDIQSHIVQIPPSLKAVENIAHTVS